MLGHIHFVERVWDDYKKSEGQFLLRSKVQLKNTLNEAPRKAVLQSTECLQKQLQTLTTVDSIRLPVTEH